MKNLPLLIVTVLGSLALIVGIAVLFSQQTAPQLRSYDPATLAANARNSKGPETAKVTIVEFSDFQCPYCKSIDPTVQAILAQHPNDVRLIYRHFPLTNIHPYAQLAAQASEVAGKEGKFWEYHQVLFANQEGWSKMTSIGEVKETFGDYAQQIGIDKAAFLSKVDADEVKSKVLEDVTLGGKVQINSTPTFFINGQETAPGQSLSDKVEELLQSS